MPHNRFCSGCLAVLLALVVAPWPSWAVDDPPDVEINPQSGLIEVTDAFLDGGDYEIRHVVKPNSGPALVETVLTSDAAGDLGSRIDIKSDGETWVVWWRDSTTDEVLYRVRDYQTGAWTAEARISTPGVGSRHPEIVHDGTKTWVAFEADAVSATAIAVSATNDGAEPFPTVTIVGATLFTGNPDVLIESVLGHVWITWVDSAEKVAWSEYDHGTGLWSEPLLESYAEKAEDAREIIRSTVLGP